MQEELLQLFPAEKRAFWCRAVKEKHLQEIRIRVNRPIILQVAGKEFFLNREGGLQEDGKYAYRACEEEIEQLINHICHYSLYAYEEELRQGFLTVKGGHRVGITGQVVPAQDGGIRTIKNISCMNIRIAHEVIGAADKVLPLLYEGGRMKNVLIISPPGCGKTTLLRDLIRQISNGNPYGSGKSVGVVDERSEIAGSWQGIPQNDVGIRTDVLDTCPKLQGMMLLLRAMSPQVIAIDELGGLDEMSALRAASFCGVGVLATAHGESVEDVMKRFEEKGKDSVFDIYILLGKENGKPVILKVIGKEEYHASIDRRSYDIGRMRRSWNVVPAAVHSAVEACQNPAGNPGNVDRRDQLWKNDVSGMLPKNIGQIASAL